jgi:hypothetical protein
VRTILWKPILSAAVLTACFVDGASAQTTTKKPTTETKLYKRASLPMGQAQLDLGTGAYTRGPVVNDRACTTITDFRNPDSFDGAGVGWLSVDTGGGSCRWFSNAAKGFGANQSSNLSDLMDQIRFSYCSSALDVGWGGPGGAATLGFYEGYTVFGGAPTTAAVVLSLTGMPAHTTSSSFLGPDSCYTLTVKFPSLLPFADNVFMGYSWRFDDVGTDGVLGATYPFLACVVSCSGLSIATQGTAGGVGTNPLALGEDGQGMLDVIDQFCSSPAVSATFTFGTVAPAFAPTTRTSMNMHMIAEAQDLASTAVSYNATLTPNSDILTATNAIVGTNWTATLTRVPVTGIGWFTVWLFASQTPPAGLAPPPLHVGRRLVAGINYIPPFPTGGFFAPHNGTTGSVTYLIPPDCILINLPWAAQARTSPGGLFELSSAVKGVVGTF